jgi:hypothetical protein
MVRAWIEGNDRGQIPRVGTKEQYGGVRVRSVAEFKIKFTSYASDSCRDKVNTVDLYVNYINIKHINYSCL